MKIIIDKTSDDEVVKEKKVKVKEKPEKYIVSRKSSDGGKYIGVLLLGVVGGIIGGVLSTLVVMEDFNLSNNSTQSGAVTNSTVTSYSFETVENPVVAISKQVGPSVVGVRVSYKAQTFFGTTDAEGEGSGIVYSKDGYIITNYHVVEQAINDTSSKVQVILSTGDVLDAKVVGGDSVTDIAVIKVEKTGLAAAEFGDSDAIEVGELAVAIGNPLGQEFAGSVTVGYVVGINTAKISATGVEGMGFSIPINEALPIVEELITNKKVSRPYIGISGVSIDETDARRYALVEGVYVQSVEIKSPAEVGGLCQGDVIVEVNGTKVLSVPEINVIKNKLKIGDKIKIKVYRDKEYKELTITLGEN